MEIANPIYDAAFKYLMQDDRAARLLVGRIAGLDIESLELRPQELAAPRDAAPRDNGAAAQPLLALFRMDFAARVRTPAGGERQVLIEIQKTNAGHPFIAGIHHRSHIVQIPRLRGRRRDELERVLSIFDQGDARIERGGLRC